MAKDPSAREGLGGPGGPGGRGDRDTSGLVPRWARRGLVLLRPLRVGYQLTHRYLPLTDLGVVVLGVGVLVLTAYGFPRADYVVQLAGAAAIGLVALGLLAVLIGALWAFRLDDPRRAFASAASAPPKARAPAAGPPGKPPGPRESEGREDPDRSPGALRFEARRGFAWGRRWPRISWLPLVDIEVEARSPAGLRMERVEGFERLEARHRGGSEQLVRTYTVEDAFGLARLRFERVEARAVEVAPWLGALDRAPALTTLAEGASRAHPLGRPAGDRVEMRPYVRGDPLRLVLWKVYARTGQLMVRTAERALDEDSEVYAYLVAGVGDEPSAAAAWVAVTRGLLGPRWRFAADGTPGSTDHREAAAAAIARSRSARTKSGLALPEMLREVRMGEGGRVILFLPCRPGPWMERVVEHVSGLGGRVSAVVAHDGLRPEAPARRGWLRKPEADSEAEEASPSAHELDEVLKTLAFGGLDLMVIDRPSGRAGASALPRRVA